MRYLKSFITLCLYAVCSILIGKISIYFFARFSKVIDAIFSSNALLPSTLVAYLFMLAAISFVILFGANKIKIFPYFIYFALIASLLYIGAFRFIYFPDFEPLELVYVANDAAMYGAIMGFFCLLVKSENLNGIIRWKL